MAIISRIEAKSTKGKLLFALIFTMLSIGGLTMLYPFAIMLSGSLRSELDETDLDLIPSYFFNTDVLYRKFLETKYNQKIVELNQATLQQNFNFRRAEVPTSINETLNSDFETFFKDENFPLHWQTLGGVVGVKTVPENLRELRSRLEKHFDGNIDAFAREVGGAASSWQNIVIANPDWLSLRYSMPDNTTTRIYRQMLEEAPLVNRQIVSLSGYFLEIMVYPTYGSTTTAAYNKVMEYQLDEYGDFRLPAMVPGLDQPHFRRSWIEFVREDLNPSFVVLPDTADSAFQGYLRETYGTIEELNRAWGAGHTAFTDIILPTGEWVSGAFRTDYHEFLLGLEPEAYQIVGPEYSWYQWLAAQYGSVEQLNQAAGTGYSTFNQVLMPVEGISYAYVQDNVWKLRGTYAARNFINVFDELFLRGRAFTNTVIFCTLSVALSLLVNPLTAYAMSRFRLPGTYKMLLLLMATMAFPPMVTLIPTFIILQKLQLMNTFAALILPTIANGYLIFLLKGFFDSLPRELYEAATIDGASEMRIFFQITMSLSKPILAVVALMAFNSAYTVFLFPLLVAPSEDMWLLSVWLFQYQQNASMGGIFASVLIASIPTLLLFIFCQNIIMRGIVVPVEK